MTLKDASGRISWVQFKDHRIDVGNGRELMDLGCDWVAVGANLDWRLSDVLARSLEQVDENPHVREIIERRAVDLVLTTVASHLTYLDQMLNDFQAWTSANSV
ncbi:hypothetical protein ACFYO1_29425 [Nocardia sp. NPDC006044]|uniref:hypothetical protein n=1 Tax=Nocardia sp. NPDC006044 TaxID=3364306 RepID=UPI00368C5FB6